MCKVWGLKVTQKCRYLCTVAWHSPIFDDSLIKSYLNTKKYKNSTEGRYRTCISWYKYSVQRRSSKKWSWCMLEKCVKHNHYARFHTQSHCCCREKWTMSRAPGHGVCSKSVSQLRCKVSYSQLYCREMHYISRLNIKFWQSQRSMKCRSRAPCHIVWLLRDDYYARFHTPSYHCYHCCGEMHFISRLDIKFWQSW